ncbi:MAG: FAD-binding protein [Bacteroidia bacterium]|nr:FAD-binding protein [Bacteroidia bacterium]
MIYATDASIYREIPDAVAYPESSNDIVKLLAFARKYSCPLIPRAAGTSLAGQCVGTGIVVDVSKYMCNILELNVEERWVKVQPGVIRDQLNDHLREHGLHFGPNTSTANRAMIGGMVGNNSSGSTSIVYGTTRDHTMAIRAVLSDGSKATFKKLNSKEFEEECEGQHKEAELYRMIKSELSRKEVQQEIIEQFPKTSIHRRNTGYAIDELIKQKPFSEQGDDFNFCSLLCGSEGTLAFITEVQLSLDPLPPKFNALVCPHFSSVNTALKAVLIAMKHKLYACELMDKFIMDCARRNKVQLENMHFVNGDPAALLMLEVAADTENELEQKINVLKGDMETLGNAEVSTIIYGDMIKAAWEVRKAGLGVLSNIPGDKKAIACIEDTAVALEDLPQYIEDFTKMMDGYGQKAVYYAHAGAGELHLRPMLDLRSDADKEIFKEICRSSAELVKEYKGSLSGEHGDGRVRAAFIKDMIGLNNYQLLERIKHAWDPDNILNPGKIVNAKSIDTDLRFTALANEREPKTILDFSDTMGLLRAAEKCNGSGDCRKLGASGGGMCPSYRATRNEKDTTRARANALREVLTHSTSKNVFNSEELKEVMDLCISCKACANECPSNVDVSAMKAEFLHHYYKSNKMPFRDKLIANNARINKITSMLPAIANLVSRSRTFRRSIRVATKRRLPELQSSTFRKWVKTRQAGEFDVTQTKQVYLFVDEFSNYYDVEIGKKSYLLLQNLGYRVHVVNHPESGRASISKGMLKRAKKLANANVKRFSSIVKEDSVLLGIEPSAILSFRDEYPKLVSKNLVDRSNELAQLVFCIDEFLSDEFKEGNIDSSLFTENECAVSLHVHCHQKALSSPRKALEFLKIPKHYKVELIASGCCGMAGSFGYEKEHYEVSMAMGELALFPAVRNASFDSKIAASGTSCRHQILDGTGRQALHPVEIIYDALRINENTGSQY